jgi:hypothetical protein
MEMAKPSLLATAGPCRVLVATAASEGSDDNRLRRYATTTDTVFVVFGGRVWDQQPVWRTTLDFVWAKFRHELGLKAEAAPVFFVIATKGCDVERLPWGELGEAAATPGRITSIPNRWGEAGKTVASLRPA